MSLKSKMFTASGTFSVPLGVTFLWASYIGSGGGAVACPGSDANGGGGGGSGEFWHMMPIPVVSRQTLAITIGAGGLGGIGATNVGGQDGADTTFGGFTALGGLGGRNRSTGVNNAFLGADGGGPNAGHGGNTPNGPGIDGAAESPTCFGGAGGGAGSSASGNGGDAGQFIGQWAQPGTAVTVNHPGGSGGCSVLSSGGAGSSTGNGADGGVGSGGGGGCGSIINNGGSGSGGAVMLFWIEP